MRYLPLLLILAACGPEPEMPKAEAPPLPAALCDKAREGLEQMRAKGAIDYDEGGAATIPQDSWMVMGSAAHGQLAQMLAFHAACANPDGSAGRMIVIRNESGVVLMETEVPTTVGLGALEDE